MRFVGFGVVVKFMDTLGDRDKAFSQVYRLGRYLQAGEEGSRYKQGRMSEGAADCCSHALPNWFSCASYLIP